MSKMVFSGTGTAYPSGAPVFTPGFLWSSCYSIFSFMCMFGRSLFVLLSFFFWPLCFLFFFDLRVLITSLWYLRFTGSDYTFGILDLRVLITPLVSSNTS